MRRRHAARIPPLLATIVLVLGGCDTEESTTQRAPSATAQAESIPKPADGAGFDVGEIKTAAEYLAEPRFAPANRERGELLSLACAACHTFGAGEQHNIGPNLHGVFGRRAGSLSGFAYTTALRESGLVWTPRAVEAWLVEPARFIPGTSMAFAGFRSEDDRRDLLAYLLDATQ